MKSIFRLLLVCVFAFATQLSFATNPISENYETTEVISVEQFLDLKYADVKKASKAKLTVSDRLNFFATKKYLKMKVAKGQISEEDSLAEAAAGFKFKIGPFIVGFFLGLLGLLLVWVVVPKPRKNAMVSCLIGALVWGVLFGALFA